MSCVLQEEFQSCLDLLEILTGAQLAFDTWTSTFLHWYGLDYLLVLGPKDWLEATLGRPLQFRYCSGQAFQETQGVSGSRCVRFCFFEAREKLFSDCSKKSSKRSL